MPSCRAGELAERKWPQGQQGQGKLGDRVPNDWGIETVRHVFKDQV